MIYDIKQCGERIHQLRLNSGYTQEQLAEKLNIDRSFYSRIETGRKGCSVDLLVHLSSVFNVSLDYLVLGRYHVAGTSSTDKMQLKEEMNQLAAHLKQFGAAI